MTSDASVGDLGGAPTSATPLPLTPALADSIKELIKQTLREGSVTHSKGKSKSRSRGHSRRRRARSPSSGEASESSSRSGRRHRRHYRSRSKRSKRSRERGSDSESVGSEHPSTSSDPALQASARFWQGETYSSHSDSNQDEGALSAEEKDNDRSSKSDRLCPPDLYYRVMTKASTAIKLEMPIPAPVPDDHKATTYPKSSPGPLAIPFPEALEDIFDTEWASLHRTKHHRNIDRLYTLPNKIMKRIKVPSVDPPVVAVANATTLPSEGEMGPKEPADKKAEMSFRKGFEHSSNAFRATVACSNLTRAVLIWSDELIAQEPKLSTKAKSMIKKMGLAAAAAADASYDAMQESARSMGSSVLGRRQIWLRNWQGDSASTSRILSLPFKGEKLFGDELDPMLVEDSDKRKVLPSKKVPPKKQPFRGTTSGFKHRPAYQPSRQRWQKGKPGSKYRKQGNTSNFGAKGKPDPQPS